MCERGRGTIVAVDPFLLLLFLPKAVPCSRATRRVHRLYQEQGEEGTEQQGAGEPVPLNLFSQFYFLLFSHPPPSTSTSGGAARAQELQ